MAENNETGGVATEAPPAEMKPTKTVTRRRSSRETAAAVDAMFDPETPIGPIETRAPDAPAPATAPASAPASAPATAKLEDVTLPDMALAEHLLAETARYDEALETDQEFRQSELSKTTVENRAEVESLNRLQHERRMVSRALAPLSGLFEGGQNPAVDSKRKQHRALVGTLIATERGITGDKVESLLERLANADPRHIAFCDQLDALRIKYHLLKDLQTQYNERIRSREAEIRAYASEPKV